MSLELATEKVEAVEIELKKQRAQHLEDLSNIDDKYKAAEAKAKAVYTEFIQGVRQKGKEAIMEERRQKGELSNDVARLTAEAQAMEAMYKSMLEEVSQNRDGLRYETRYPKLGVFGRVPRVGMMYSWCMHLNVINFSSYHHTGAHDTVERPRCPASRHDLLAPTPGERK